MKNKIVYETLWSAKDSKKEYPHGWGFTPLLVEFPKDADPAWCGEMCRLHLSNEEFECYGAVPRKVIDGNFSFEYPKNVGEFELWKENK